MKKNLLPLLLLSLLTINSFAQELPNQSNSEETIIVEEGSSNSSDKEEVHHEAYELLTNNDTLAEIEEHKELILDDEETDWDIIKDIPKDTWNFVKAPAGWTKKEWLVASGVVTMTSLLMTGDKVVQDFFQENKTEFTKDVAYFAEMGGSQAWVGLTASYLVGTILKNKKLKKASVLAFSSMLISGVLVQGLKQVFARTRPYAATNQWEFQGPGLRSSTFNSFPSGHTASAFSVAAAISTIYDSKLVKILAYSAATLTGLSRIHDNKHWMSDVFMGAVLGTVTGIFVAKSHMKYINGNSKVNLSPAILNVQGQNAYGLSLTIKLDSNKKKKRRRKD